jgi:hypothetical protein
MNKSTSIHSDLQSTSISSDYQRTSTTALRAIGTDKGCRKTNGTVY